MLPHVDALSRVVRSCIDREAADGWARMRRVPSTYTWRVLDYLARLEPSRQRSLFDAFVANALFHFDPSRDPLLHAHRGGHREYVAMVEALPQMGGFEYWGLRLLRGMLGDLKSP